MIRLRILYFVLTCGLLVFGASGVFTGLRYRSAQPISYASYVQQKPAGWFTISGAAYDLTEGATYVKSKKIEALYVPLRAASELGKNEDKSPVRAFLVIRPQRSRAVTDLYEQTRAVLNSNDTKKILALLQKNRSQLFYKGAVKGMTSQRLEIGSDIAETSKLRSEYPNMAADVAFFESEKTPTLAGPAAMLLGGIALSALGLRSLRSKIKKTPATPVFIPNAATPQATIFNAPTSTSSAPPIPPDSSSSGSPPSPWN